MKKDEKLDGLDYRIILALADNRMRIMDTARAVYVDRNTILYRTDKIQRLTGLNPNNFYDLHKLVKMVKGENHGEEKSLT